MVPLFFSNLEYISLRLVRRFVFPKDLDRIGRYLPWYRPNLAATQPDSICNLYTDWLASAGRSVVGRRVIEVGSGATNGTGYAVACAGAAHVWCVEPYASLDRRSDSFLLTQVARTRGREPAEIAAAVTRCRSLESIARGTADLVLSHSVLEHVADPARLFLELRKTLATGGGMLHVVDYRDHFFKYPLHFLQFSAQAWRRFLDPGDLPRWRLADHLRALAEAGFHTRVLQQQDDPREFERIRAYVSSDFDVTDPTLGILRAVLYCESRDGQ